MDKLFKIALILLLSILINFKLSANVSFFSTKTSLIERVGEVIYVNGFIQRENFISEVRSRRSIMQGSFEPFKAAVRNAESSGQAPPLALSTDYAQYTTKYDTESAFYLGFEYMKMYTETVFEPAVLAVAIGRMHKVISSYKRFRPLKGIRDVLAEAGGKIFNNITDAVGSHIDDITTRLYRGDLRTPDEIFGSGFTAKGTNSDIVDYVELNEPSIFIGTSKSPQEAFTKVSQAQTEGYVYVLGKNGNTTDVNNWYNSIEGYPNPYASELEVVFENAIPSSNIQGAFKINSSGDIIGDIIVNPNFVP